MRAQAASLPFTPVYAALVAIVNTKLPQVGLLLVSRLVMQFRRAFRRNDKAVCLSSTTFMAHLCNYQVLHEILVLQILQLLLDKPTDDSVEIAVGLMREVGAYLAESSSAANNFVYERFRTILHEGALERRTQYMIEVLFLVRKNGYAEHPAVVPELDLIEEEDQITHLVELESQLVVDDKLNVFQFDDQYEANEAKYRELRDDILGGDDESEAEAESSDESEPEEAAPAAGGAVIKDMTNRDLVNLRKTIYLTIRSSMDFEECCHKLMKINLSPGQEIELVNMIVECCSQEKTYMKFYGLIGERFCKLNRNWAELFATAFRSYYETIHRYETNKIRNIGRFFGHCLCSEGLPWEVLECIHLNEDETTASSRIYIKILFQDMVESLGLRRVEKTLAEPYLQPALAGIFPRDSLQNTRFAVNFFTAIGLGSLTEALRAHLKTALAAQAALAASP
ncbi:armadillo-type protein [Dipodascopsis tothii]|uniref:armadillo-type protein n=1 Tax=Dipodascopsis tothii TaxID=44089 RepID=UPI0034CFDAE0